MTKQILFAVGLIFVLVSTGMAQPVMKFIAQPQNTYLTGALANGNEFYMQGERQGTVSSYLDLFKLDAAANLEWSTEIQYDTNRVYYDLEGAMVNAPGNGIYLVSSVTKNNGFNSGLVTAVSSTGTVQWTLSLAYPGYSVSFANGVQAGNGDLLLTGLYVYQGIGGYFVARVTSAGALSWVKKMTTLNSISESFVINNGGAPGQYLLCAYEAITGDMAVGMMDDNGNIQWGRCIMPGANGAIFPLATYYNAAAQNYNIVSQISSFTSLNHFLITKINPVTGAVISARSYSFTDGAAQLSYVRSNHDTGLVLAGNYLPDSQNEDKIFYAATDADFTTVKPAHTIPFPFADHNIFGLASLSDGAIMFNGEIDSTYYFDTPTSYYCKTDIYGGGLCYDTSISITSHDTTVADSAMIITVTDITSSFTTGTISSTATAQFTAQDICPVLGVNNVAPKMSPFTVYPSPAADKINVSFPDKFTTGDITIVNSIGQSVKRLPVTSNDPLSIDCVNLPSGIYMVVLHSSIGVSTQKFLKE